MKNFKQVFIKDEAPTSSPVRNASDAGRHSWYLQVLQRRALPKLATQAGNPPTCPTPGFGRREHYSPSLPCLTVGRKLRRIFASHPSATVRGFGRGVFSSDAEADRPNQEGIATLLVVSVLTIVFVTLSIAMARTNLVKFKSLETLKNSRKNYYLSETGIEDTLFQLVENINYSGNPDGEETPIGTYYSLIDNTDDVYNINSWAEEGITKRIVDLNITISYEIAEVTTKAAYMADFFWINGVSARIRGDVWTNDDFEIVENGVIEGNLTAAGEGSFAVNWVWDGIFGGNPSLQGGQVLDNPDTPELDGNITAADDVKVSGPSAYVQGDVVSDGDVYEMFGGTIDGVIIEEAGLAWDEIPVPHFDFEDYEQQAIQKGTWFSDSSSFENYVNSLDNGNERRLPDDLYYVQSGTLKIYEGNPVYLDGLLVVEDSIYLYCEWYQSAQDGLPALISGNDIKIENRFRLWPWGYVEAGDVIINGIVSAESDIVLIRRFSGESIEIDGAVWAGDDMYVQERTFINYNVDPMNVVGFGFVSGISDLQKNCWQEIID